MPSPETRPWACFLRLFSALLQLPGAWASRLRLLPSAFCLLPFACCLLPSPGRAVESLTLDDCLRETAAANGSVVGQQFAIEQAYGQRLVFRSRALPTLSFTALGGYQGAQTSETVRQSGVDANGKPLPNVSVPRTSTAIAIASGQLTQPIFDAAIPASWRLGTLGVTAAKISVYTVATAQLFRARTLFNRAVYYHEREALLNLTNRNVESNLRAQNALLNAGLGTRQGVLSAQVQRGAFGPVLSANTGTYRSTLASLLQVMGRHLPEATGKADPLDGFALTGQIEDAPLSFDPAEATREALAHRPDIENLRTTMRIYTENANVARAGYYPTVKLYLAGQYLPQTYIQAQNASTRASDRVQTTELRPGARVDWAIIDTGTVLGSTRQYGALVEVIGATLHRMEESVGADLATVHGQAEAAAQAVALLNANIAVAQDTLNIIQTGVAQGVNSQLEFLDAQNSVFATRLGLLDAQLALGQTHAEFDRITGRYLRFVTEPRPAAHAADTRK